MKTRFLSTLTALAIAQMSFAQSSAVLPTLLRGPHTARQQALIDALLRSQQPSAAAKTTAPTQRIIGYSATNVITGDVRDSLRMTYGSQERGSDHSGNDLSSYYFSYDPTYLHWQPVENFLQGGDLRIKADTVVMEDVDGVYGSSALSYNAAQQPTSYRSYYFFAGVPDGRDRYTMTYNAAGQRTQFVYEADTTSGAAAPGPFLPGFRQYSTYGGTPARALKDSTVYDPAGPFFSDPERMEYSYTGGNLTQIDYFVADAGNYDLVQRIEMTYDASNRLKTVVALIDFGTGLAPLIKDSLTYTGTYTYPTESYFFLAPTGTTLDLFQINRYTLNTQGLRDTLRVFDGNNALLNLVAYQYNSYGNPDGYRSYADQGGSLVLDETGRYYYEIHNPTRVADAPLALQATAYPNPVQNTLALTWKSTAGRPTIRVADAAGRLMEQTLMSAGATAHNLDMSRYAPGTYFVSIIGDGGVVQHMKVSKQ